MQIYNLFLHINAIDIHFYEYLFVFRLCFRFDACACLRGCCFLAFIVVFFFLHCNKKTHNLFFYGVRFSEEIKKQ